VNGTKYVIDESLLSLLLGRSFDDNGFLGNNDFVLLWVRKSLTISGELEELGSGLTAGESILMISHVSTSSVWRLLFQSLDLAGGIINGEILKEGLWSLLVDMLNFLWGSVNLLLSLSLTTIKRHVDGADTFVFNTAVNDELLVIEGLDTELELNILEFSVDGGGNLSPINKMIRNCFIFRVLNLVI